MVSSQQKESTARASSFFFNDTATTEIYTLSLHDALPISVELRAHHGRIIRYLDHHDALGPARDASPRSAGRAPDAERPGDRAGARGAARAWHGRRAELRAAQSSGRHAGFHALRRRHLLRLGAAVPRPYLPRVAGPAAAQRRRGGDERSALRLKAAGRLSEPGY